MARADKRLDSPPIKEAHRKLLEDYFPVGEGPFHFHDCWRKGTWTPRRCNPRVAVLFSRALPGCPIRKAEHLHEAILELPRLSCLDPAASPSLKAKTSPPPCNMKRDSNYFLLKSAKTSLFCFGSKLLLFPVSQIAQRLRCVACV